MLADGSAKVPISPAQRERPKTVYSKSKDATIFRNREAKPCCLCWCCCFSCSCLSLQNGQPSDANKAGVPMKQRDENMFKRRQINVKTPSPEPDELKQPKVTLEELKLWTKSFDCLMNHKVGQKMFADFLKSEFSDENILFWQACEDLKNEKNSEKIEEKARIIYEDFVSILSPKEVSLDSRVREIVNNNMVRPNAHTFDEAQAQIYTLMQRDSYPRFIGSDFFKNFYAPYAEGD